METTMTTEIKSTQTDRIRTLDDELRKNFSQGHAVMTIGIAALGAEAVARIVKTIEVYDDFCHANDPHEEHDFGSFEAEGRTIFFKIAYYDPTLTVHSPDPSDPVILGGRTDASRRGRQEVPSICATTRCSLSDQRQRQR
jgi:Protein of unknown function (DUF3768)